ncbi:MAG: threonine-phosphate decarboxylase [Beijerinckiaceae bacterium]|nr:MAG: threonine-phosphate decarboxylase [Beijerinckiaceae bacterium]
MRKIQELLRSPDLQERDGPSLYHGGDLASARCLFPDAPEPFIDLSTGINPEPYPIPHLPPEIFTRLPDAGQLAELERIAALRYRAAPEAATVAAPGTQALIQLLPRLHPAKNIGILGFTYGEYERIWREAGTPPRIVEDLDGLSACEIAIVVNPNNPDGKLVPAADLAVLARQLARRGGLLIVDEAFMDPLPPQQSLVPIMPADGALVLRSFGKTYGLPGLRLGFAVAGAALAAKLRAMLGPWAVAGPAIEIGRAALADDAWLAGLSDRLAHRAAIVEKCLARCGARKIGGTSLFQLFVHPRAEELFQRFGREGVLLRRFPERPDWLRAGCVAEADVARLRAVAERVRAF